MDILVCKKKVLYIRGILLDAKDYYSALNQNAVVLCSYKEGRKICQTSPAQTQWF